MRQVQIRPLALPPTDAGPVEVINMPPPERTLLVIRCAHPMPTAAIGRAAQMMRELAPGCAVAVIPYGFTFEVWETDEPV